MQEDVTKIKKQEKIFFAQTKQAQMGEMISMIAHRWRQPLSQIAVMATRTRFALELNKFSNKDTLQSMDFINMQVQFLSDTVDDFRNFFKPNKAT